MSRDRSHRTDWFDDEADGARSAQRPAAPGKVTLTMGLCRPGIQRSPAAPGKATLTAGLRTDPAAFLRRAAPNALGLPPAVQRRHRSEVKDDAPSTDTVHEAAQR